MDAEQALYLAQARSDLRAYDLLEPAEPCHRIHYLQMATEKLAKAYFWKQGHPLRKRHDYFVAFLRAAGGNGQVGRVVGIQPAGNWASAVNGVLPVALWPSNKWPRPRRVTGRTRNTRGRTTRPRAPRCPITSRCGTKYGGHAGSG